MNSLAIRFPRQFGSLQLSGLMLIALLQRTPVLRLLVSADSLWLRSSLGHVLRSTTLVAGALGVVDTLAGATTFTTNPASPASATVGTPFSGAFALTGATGATGSYTISGLPPGLTVPGATASGGELLLNNSSGTISGTPTTAGNYAVSITAWQFGNATGDSIPNSYTINVTGGVGATAPSISSHPANQSVTAGQSASFSVTASGTAPLTYQWRKDGNAIAGATSSTYSIPSTVTGDSGTYSVVVTNSAGSATSNNATLTVTAAAVAPFISSHPANQSVTTGQSASFSVTAGGTAPLSYQWRKNGANLAGATNSTYSIASVATGDAGTYSVVVTNSAGSVTSNDATLTVTAAAVAPSITTQPANQSVTTGQPASFSVTAGGTAPLTYQWRKDGASIGSATNATYSIASTATGDAGAYSVVVTNSAGSVTSNSATLTVTPGVTAPSITAQPSNQTVTTGFSVTFSASASGGTLQWQSSTNGTTWTSLGNDTTYSGTTTGALTISGATTALNGLRYRLNATNAGGTTSSNGAVLTVLAVVFPSPMGVALDSTGTLYVADSANNNIHKVTSAGVATRLAGGSSGAGSTDGAGTAALFNMPGSLVVDSAGVTFVADTANATIRRIATDGTVTTFAGSAAGRGNTDGPGPAASFSSTAAITIDSSGNLYVADGTTHTVRKITSAAAVTTLAGTAGTLGTADGSGAGARFNHPTGIAADSAGNLYVADTTNNTIRKVTAAGAVTTLAGLAGVSGSSDGSGASALFNGPAGLAVDSAGNVYVADSGNSIIRKITAAGAVSTLAGLPTIAGLQDGTGSGAWFNQPKAVAVDASGTVFVADTGNASIRKITPAGVVTTLALSIATTPAPTPTPTPAPTPMPAPSGGGGGGAPSLWFVGLLLLLGLARRRHVRGAG